MEIDDYESLPTTSIGVNMTAGALAGVLEHCLMYPLDSVKTRMQSLSPATSSYGISTTLANMIKKEGILRPVRGLTAVVAGAGPAHALYFASYEFTKELLTKVTFHNNMNYMASAIVATLIHDAVSNPTEVIKQRMQMYDSPYKSVVACMKGVYQNEGFKAFYRSYSTQLVMNIPNQTIHFATYEFFQNMLNQERRYNPKVHVIAGGAAGAVAAAVTTPLDVVKTLLNTQERGFTRGMAEAIRKIYTAAGPMGFFKGLGARVLYSMPATAICWSTYEFFKFYLCGMDSSQYKSSITGKTHLQPRDTSSDIIIVNEAALQEAKIHEQKIGYVLPNTSDKAENHSETNETSHSSAATKTPTASSSSSSTTTTSSAIAASGSIKTVCEPFSKNVATPTLNLHTRHNDVKSPFDRGFSTST